MRTIIFITLTLCLACQGFIHGQSCIDIDVPFCPRGGGVNPLIHLPPTQLKTFNACDTTIIQPQFGTVTIDPANANIDGTYFYNPNTNCSPVDTFTVLECCDIMGQTVCDTLEQYYLHLTFECETPPDLFCCIPDNGQLITFDVLENDEGFIAATYPDYTTLELTIEDIVMEPVNGVIEIVTDTAITYITPNDFMGVDSIVYEVFYSLTDGIDTVEICDEQTMYIVVEDCLQTVTDVLTIAPGDTVYFNALANDFIEPDIEHPCIDTLDCQNPLPEIDSSSFTLLTPGAELDTLGNGNLCFSSPTGGCFSYEYEVCSTVGVCAMDSIVIKVGNSCLSFDGQDDKIEAGNILDGIGTGDFTYEARIKANAAGQNTHPIIFSNRTTESTEPGTIFLLHSGSPFKLLAVQINATNYLVPNNGTYNASLLDDTCHHVAISRSGDILSFYIDGALIGTRVIGNASSIASGGNLIIGNENPTNNDFLGNISDVRIWDTALTANQIQINSSTTLSGNEANLLANWKMNEGIGQTVFDSSINGYNGVLGSNSTNQAIDPIWGADCCTSWNYCEPIIDLGTTTLPSGTVHAQNQVLTSGTVPAGTNVSLKAGQCIRLDAGFNSDTNADLQLIIEDCTPQ